MPLRTHPSDDGPVLDAHLACARCRYDLAGTHVLRRCPECGLEVMASVVASGDPDAAGLARAESPRAASTAVLALSLGPFVAVVLQGSGPALRVVDSMVGRGASFPAQVERPSWLASGIVLLVAAALVARGLGARRNPTLRTVGGPRRVTAVAGGLALWGAVLVAGFVASLTASMQSNALPVLVLAAQLLPACLALAVAGPLAGRIGALSRAYREARHGRQSAELVTVTLAAGITLWVAAPGIAAVANPDLGDVAAAFGIFLLALTVLGLAYLVANAWVIAAALRAPWIDPRRLQ
jgi:hypothetical protein